MLTFILYSVCAILGYLVGCLNPAHFIAQLKKINLKERGTGNLGATNATLVLGKKYGVLIMIFDILKCAAIIKLTELMIKGDAIASTISGISCILGHIFPFYLGFRGGKGLATYGGFVLAYSPKLLLLLLIVAFTMAFVTNYSISFPLTACILFPILVCATNGNYTVNILIVAVSIIMFFKHTDNFIRIVKGEEVTVDQFIKNHLLKKDDGEVK